MNYKYNIYWELQKMPHNQMKAARKWLAGACGISIYTFNNWIYAKAGDSLEIPFSCLCLLSDFFGVQIEEMANVQRIERPRELFTNTLQDVQRKN